MDVVVSTRCRIARNLAEYTFMGAAGSDELAHITVRCVRTVANVEPLCGVYDRRSLNADLAADLVVRRYVTFRWAVSPLPGAVLVDPGGLWSVMVAEEDHLRIQALVAGCDPERPFSAALGVASRIEERVAFAKRPGFGYLTTSLSNTGTGIRLSYLLHLPALAETQDYEATLAAAEQMGCSVRGAFGEGTRGTGAFVQVSNRCTYGPGAESALQLTYGAVRYLIEREREARGTLLARRGGLGDLEAACEGAADTLLRGHPTATEIVQCLSTLRLGQALGVTRGELLRTGEWMALAGYSVAARQRGGVGAERFAEMRALATIRSGLRQAGAGYVGG